MQSVDYSHIFSLPDDINAKIMMNMTLIEFISFMTTYPSMNKNEYLRDILKHFYLKYKLPISYSFDELVDHFKMSKIDKLSVTIIRDDIDDFMRVLERS